METFTKSEIVLFPFPYTNLKKSKVRPCLVLSNEMKQDLILCQITSKKTNPDIYCVEISNNETINGTLSIDSLVRCNMIFTADKKQIIKKICKVSEKKYKEIIEKIISIIQ